MTRASLKAAAMRATANLRHWSREENGLEAVEWVLLLAGGVIPLSVIMFHVLRAVVFYYEVTSWGVSLPFP